MSPASGATGGGSGPRFRDRVLALLAGREPVPDGFAGELATGERVLADATGPRGSVVLATDRGLWLPPPEAAVEPRRVPWHLVSRARWESGALEVVEAEPEELDGGVSLLVDTPARRVPLARPGRVPETVHKRVTDPIVHRQHHEIGAGGAWFVQRRVPGRGVLVQVRPDVGTDLDAVRAVAVGLGERLRDAGR